MRRAISVFLVFALFSVSAYAADTVAARVNGTVITISALNAEVDRLVPRSLFHGNISEEKRNEYNEKALKELIDRELQYQDALLRGMKPDKKQVKKIMDEVRDSFKSKKAYKAALAQAKISEEEYESQISKAVLVQSATEKTVVEPARMSERELREYYTTNSDKFKQPESVQLRLLSTKNENKAREALARIKKGEDFGRVASEISEDQFRVKGGDIGFQHRGKLLPEIEEAAFIMKPGDLSGLIKANDTWFIIRLEDKQPEKQLSFDESKDKLKQELETKRARELKEKWITELRAKAKIEILLNLDRD